MDGEFDNRRALRVIPGNGMATVSLVLGVLALCGGLTAIPGLICGIIGLTRASSRNGAGYGFAIAGMILSGIGLLTALPLMIALLLPAVQKVREASARMQSTNNLKQLTSGQENYQSANGVYPQPYYYVGPRGGEPEKLSDRLSWRVAMLPYMEQDNLYKQFRLAEPWNSSANEPHSNVRIKTLIHPADAGGEPTTRYRVFYGGGAAYDLDKTRAVIQDGTTNTIAIVEGGERVTWTQFNDYPFSMDGPLPTLGLPNATVFQAGMFDGSVRTIKKSIDPMVLKRGIHASDGSPLND